MLEDRRMKLPVKESLISLIDTMTENQIIYTYEFLSLIFGKEGAKA